LISWKHSFRRLSEEYEVARKKRQALDNLLGTGRISQSTHDMFDKEIDDAIAEIEKQQKVLLEKMATKVIELEGQVKTMEILLANSEIRHVTGEIDEETYQRENDLLSIGLDTVKNELEEVKEATNQLATGEFPLDQATEQQPEETETPQPEVKFLEETASEGKKAEPNEEPVVEAVTCTEVTATNDEVKTEEKQQA
jgi:hypothetical protein